MEIELWKEIKLHPDYDVSNLGRIRRKDNQEILKCGLTQKGKYVRVNLNGKLRRVHRLVGFAFVTNPNPKLFKDVHHKDKNPQNNAAYNLEWTDNDNNNKSHNKNPNGKRGIPYTKDQVMYILLNKGHKTATILAEELNKTSDSVSDVWRGSGKKNNLWRIEYFSQDPSNKHEFKIK